MQKIIWVVIIVLVIAGVFFYGSRQTQAPISNDLTPEGFVEPGYVPDEAIIH